MKRGMILALVLFAATSADAAFDTATFADTGAISGAGQFNSETGGFTSGGQFFNNTFSVDPTFGVFSTGFSVSSVTDNATPGFMNQYSAITGGGNGDPYYAVLTPDAYVNLSGTVQSIDLTNTTYAYFSMKNGDDFEDAFTTGSFFKVVITGYSGFDDGGDPTGSVTVSLADYAGPKDNPLKAWKTVDLTALGSAKSLGFDFLSSASNSFGITTPEYVAVDNLVTSTAVPAVVPEPSSWLLCLSTIGIGAAGRRLRLARIARV